MYTLEDVKKGIRNPVSIGREIRRQYEKRLNSLYGIDYLEEDWDNLILLDGCRYDLFEYVSTIDGDLSCQKSNSSSSDEYFEKNFDGGEFGDIVYFSANPHIDNIDAHFYDIVRLWETDWDEETGTVLPSDAVDRVLEREEEYRDKRIVLHLMQPHRPFLGEHAKNIDQTGLSREGVQRQHGEDPEIPFWWHRLQRGELTREEIWPAYKETLEVTLPYVEKLLDELPGKSVVSADHGNAFGENNLYGHPSYRHHPSINDVPWLEVNKPRKEIVEEKPTAKAKREHFDQATDRLEALGYIQ